MLFFLAVYTASALKCYTNYGVQQDCVSPDSTPAQCASVTTIQGSVEVACRSELVCQFYADLVDEGIIQSYKCCGEDSCNDPGNAPPAQGQPGAKNATDPNDPVYRCAPYETWPAWIGTADECISQHDGTECVFCSVYNPSGDGRRFQMCSPRFNYSCFEIETSYEIDQGYCSAGWACPAGTVLPNFFLLAAVAVSFLFSLSR